MYHRLTVPLHRTSIKGDSKSIPLKFRAKKKRFGFKCANGRSSSTSFLIVAKNAAPLPPRDSKFQTPRHTLSFPSSSVLLGERVVAGLRRPRFTLAFGCKVRRCSTSLLGPPFRTSRRHVTRPLTDQHQSTLASRGSLGAAQALLWACSNRGDSS